MRPGALLMAAMALLVMGLTSTTSLAQTGGNPVRVVVRSNPTGAEIHRGTRVVGLAPDTLLFQPGDRELQVVLPGYQPLYHRFTAEVGPTLTLEFILVQTPPEMPTPESLGQEYWPTAPLQPEKEADALRRKYNAMAETFLIFPTAQGLIGILAFDDDDSFPGRELFVTGVALVSLSYLAGKYFSNRKRQHIIESNTILEESNYAAETHNAEIDQLITTAHAANVIDWQRRAEDRGVVHEYR